MFSSEIIKRPLKWYHVLKITAEFNQTIALNWCDKWDRDGKNYLLHSLHFFFENNHKPVFHLLSADGGCTGCVGVGVGVGGVSVVGVSDSAEVLLQNKVILVNYISINGNGIN